MYKSLLVLLFILIFISSAQAIEPHESIHQADVSFVLRQNLSFAEENVRYLRQALEMDPENYEAAWKLARGLYWVAKSMPDEALQYNEQGEEAARRAISINPEGWEGHLWLGICMGRVGEERGVLNSLFLVDPIKEEMEKVIKINPDNDVAYYVLSVLYRKAPGWPLSIGDIDKSLKFANKAVKLAPERHTNYLGLAETLIAKDNKEKAKEYLTMVINMPFEDDRIAEGEEDKQRAKEILETL